MSRRRTSQDAYVFFTVREKYRVPLRAVNDLIMALNESISLPQRIAVVRFWAIYLRSIGMHVPELPPLEEMDADKVRSIAEAIIANIAKAIGISEESVE